MSLFLRIFQWLLPRSATWRLSFNKTLRYFFEGLTALPDAIRTYVDLIWLDIFPASTRQLPMWLTQFGLEPGADDDASRAQLDTAWKAQGGQSPNYLQTILQGAGFPLYVHEWWTGDPPFAQVCCHDTLAECGEPTALASYQTFRRFVRDPRQYTVQPAIGTVECSALSDQTECDATVTQAQANAFLTNNPGYLVNDDLSRNAPPPIPDDTTASSLPLPDGYWTPQFWPYFIYLGGATFPNRVSIPASRRTELERLVLKLRPTDQWVVMLVDYSGGVPAGALTELDGTTFVTAADGSYLT